MLPPLLGPSLVVSSLLPACSLPSPSQLCPNPSAPPLPWKVPVAAAVPSTLQARPAISSSAGLQEGEGSLSTELLLFALSCGLHQDLGRWPGSCPFPVGKRGNSVPQGCPSDSRESDLDPAATKVKAAVLGPGCFQAQQWSCHDPLQGQVLSQARTDIALSTSRGILVLLTPCSKQPPPTGHSCLGLPPHPFYYHFLRPSAAHELQIS